MHIRFNNTTKIWEYDNGGVWTALLFHLTGGNVGIGTTNPQFRLHVMGGGIRMDNTHWLAAYDAEVGGNLLWRINRGGTSGNDMAFRAFDGFTFSPANSDTVRVRIDGSGNVGIGTTSPGYKLTINGGDVDIIGGGKLRMSGAGAGVYWDEAWGWRYVSDGTHPLRFSGTSLVIGYESLGTNFGSGNLFVSGNVGIGAASTGEKFRLHNIVAGTADRRLALFIDGFNGGANGQYFAILGGNGGINVIADWTNLSFGARADGTLGWKQTLTISFQDRVGIGVANPEVKLSVAGAANSPAIRISGRGAGAGNWNAIDLSYADDGSYSASIRAINKDGSPSYMRPRLGFFTQNTDTYLYGSLTERMSILAESGNVGIGTTSPAVPLDVRGVVRAGDASTQGYIQLNPGGPFNTGYLGIHKTGGTRLGYIGWDNTNFLFYAESSASFAFLNGNVGIGTGSPSRGLHVAANGIRVVGLTGSASGAYVRTDGDGVFYWDSSLREYKKNIRKFIPAHLKGFERILDVELHEFEDVETGETTIGVIADELEELGLEFLLGRHQGKLWTVHYEKLSLYLLGLLKQLIPQIRKEN